MADFKHPRKLKLVINYSLFLVQMPKIYINKGHSIYLVQTYSSGEFLMQGTEEEIANEQLAKVSVDLLVLA